MGIILVDSIISGTILKFKQENNLAAIYSMQNPLYHSNLYPKQKILAAFENIPPQKHWIFLI